VSRLKFPPDTHFYGHRPHETNAILVSLSRHSQALPLLLSLLLLLLVVLVLVVVVVVLLLLLLRSGSSTGRFHCELEIEAVECENFYDEEQQRT